MVDKWKAREMAVTHEILEMYSKGEVSGGRAAEMLGIPRAAFYQILADRKIPLPEKLNQSILKELKKSYVYSLGYMISRSFRRKKDQLIIRMPSLLDALLYLYA